MLRRLRNTESRLLNHLRMVLATVVVFMALLVMVGSITGNAAVVQIHPEFAPMQFNTALGFLLAGLTLMAGVSTYRKVPLVLGAMLLCLGVATLLQYIAARDFGIDTLFVDPVTTVRTSHPGRMAPNTAICFTLSGLAILAGFFGRRSLSGCIGAAVLGGGLVSLLGYVSGIEAAYGWGDLTRMAIHTSFGFVLVGMGLGLHGLSRWSDFLQMPLFTSGTVAVLVLTISVGAWQALVAERRRDSRTELKNVAEQSAKFVYYRMNDVFTALDRLARRSAGNATDHAAAHWDADSDAYLEHMPALLALAWHAPEGEEFITLRESDQSTLRMKTIQDAVARARASNVPEKFHIQFESDPSRKGRVLIASLSLPSVFGSPGVFVALLDTEKAFLPILEGPTSTIIYRISDAQGVLFETATSAETQVDEHYGATATLQFFGDDLFLEAVATEAFVQSRASRAAYVVLIGGVIMSVLLVLTIQLALFSWRTREAYRREYAQYRLVAKHVPAMIVAFDSKECLIFASPPLLKWLDRESASTVIGHQATEVFGSHFIPLQPRLAHAFRGKYEHFEVEFQTKAGLPEYFDVQLVPHIEADGTVISVYALMRDTTEEKLANLRLEENANQLNRFSQLAIGREETMVGLKREVNALLESTGQEPRYRIVGVDEIEMEIDP